MRAFDGRMLAAGKVRFSANRLLLKLHKGFSLTLWDPRDELVMFLPNLSLFVLCRHRTKRVHIDMSHTSNIRASLSVCRDGHP